MTLKAYAACTTNSKHTELNHKHITFAFMPAQQTGYLYINNLADLLPSKTFVRDIVHFPEADVTIAIIVTSPELLHIKSSLEDADWTYIDYKWQPHITLCKGNTPEEYAHLIGCEVTLTDLSIRLKEFN